MKIDQERPEDVTVIRILTNAAFKDAPYSNQTEAKIVDALRGAGVLTLSLTATRDGEILGHAAFSPVRINGRSCGWYGLGPVSVRPDSQRKGIGSAIIRDGLHRLKTMKVDGCVVFGDPAYYGRFGFVSDPRLYYAPAPAGYFQRLAFTKAAPIGEVAYHSGFDVV
jgi:putative acetyltransferase